MSTWVLPVTLIIPAWLLYMVVRNQMLVRYRTNLINGLYDARKVDGYSIDGEWRSAAMNKVSYGEMFWKFWRTFDSFYPDKSFAEPLLEHARRAFQALEESIKPPPSFTWPTGGSIPAPGPMAGSYSVSITAIRNTAK